MTGPIEQDRLSIRPPGATPGRRARLAACLALVLAIVPARLAADDGIADKRVLILHADNVFLPANQIMDRVLSSTLIGDGLPTASIYAEYMEAGRFAEPAQQEVIIRLFREKCRNLKIDLVIVTEDTTLGLFCNELILNSCRHAFREGEGGRISLELSKGEDDEITLLYSDDGTGLPAGCDLRREGHVGTQTLIALGEVQLRGRLEFSGLPGFSCLLRFTADLPAFTA